MTQYECPWCRYRIYRYRPIVPVVGECGQCRKPLRLVGDRYIRWSEWEQIQARAASIVGRELALATIKRMKETGELKIITQPRRPQQSASAE